LIKAAHLGKVLLFIRKVEFMNTLGYSEQEDFWNTDFPVEAEWAAEQEQAAYRGATAEDMIQLQFERGAKTLYPPMPRSPT